MYDLISGGQILKASYYLSKPQVLERFPLLKQDKLVGGLVYYDGQHEDARMCLSVALTAVRYGACISNYVEALEILKGSPSTDKAIVKFVIRARCVINATGPYTDHVRQMDDQKQAPICQPSSGVHIILPGYYTPSQMGLLDPSTRDGRVIFFLPWMNFALAGTTDNPCKLSDSPSPTEGEVNFILDEIRDYLSPDIQVRRGDVLAAWAGIRPLVRDPNSADTQSIARNHVIEVSSNRLITIAGGKWTTYRSMAEETVDKAIEVCGLQPKSPCRTKGLLLEGAHLWSPNLFIKLVQEHGMEVDVARHLTGLYGDKAINIANMASLTGMRWPILGKKLHPEFPFIEAEVKKRSTICLWAGYCQVARPKQVNFLEEYKTEELR
ncbi:unnamed protein product [Echinostoma caproni]|uniref:glycerol-3-phosphate dehydrogenase n=1 Tax=Echinostoma caproni TaxID=27848 RepID=A0A183AR78_9TREM|nr:unnamed protein product [Echinostoma caproni]